MQDNINIEVSNFQKVDPKRLIEAKKWYRTFTGKYAKNVEDKELVDMFDRLAT